MPDQHDRHHQQRGRDRPQDEEARRVHRARPRRCSCALAAVRSPSDVAVRPASAGAAAWRGAGVRRVAAAPPRRCARPCAAPATVTFAPSRSRSAPSMTTRSPGARPVDDRDALAVARAELHRPHRHRVVRLDEIDEGAGRAALHRRGRHDRRVVQRVDAAAGR